MIDRAYLKEKAKAAFQKNYWPCVGCALILTWAAGTGSASYRNFSNSYNSNNTGYNSYSYDYDDDDFDFDDLTNLDDDFDFDDYDYDDDHGDDSYSDTEDALVESMMGAMAPILVAIVLVVMAISLCLTIFVKNPFKVGCHRYFCINSFEKPKFGEVVYAFKKGQYGNVIKVMFMKDLFVFLWSLLLIIPGIIKAYEYYLVDYILSEDPTIGYKEALEQSKRMMDGYKWDLFVLELSFIGWALLAACTCGILAIFYVNPYIYATYAEFFLDRRNGYFGQNVSPYYVPSFAGMGGFNGGFNAGPVGPGGYNPDPYAQPGGYNPDPYAQPGVPNVQDPYAQPGAPMTPDPYKAPSSYAPSEPYKPATSNPGNSTSTYSLAKNDPPESTAPDASTPGSALPSGDYYNPDSTANPGSNPNPTNDDTPFGI